MTNDTHLYIERGTDGNWYVKGPQFAAQFLTEEDADLALRILRREIAEERYLTTGR